MLYLVGALTSPVPSCTDPKRERTRTMHPTEHALKPPLPCGGVGEVVPRHAETRMPQAVMAEGSRRAFSVSKQLSKKLQLHGEPRPIPATDVRPALGWRSLGEREKNQVPFQTCLTHPAKPTPCLSHTMGTLRRHSSDDLVV